MRTRLGPWALAVSLNGFFLYLGLLDAAGVAPRRASTAAWYALVGAACLAGAWLNRETLLRRLAHAPRPTRWFAIAAGVLAAWFVVNVLLVSHGSLARTFAALLVLWTLPSAVLALSLPRAQIERTAVAAVVLAGIYVAIELAAVADGRVSSTRFSPIAHLDPISAAQFPAVGAVALLALAPASRRREALRWAAVAVMVAATVLPGSRGPIVAVAAALAAGLLQLPRRSWLYAVPVLAAGFALGFAGTAAVGSSYYLTYTLPGETTSGSGPLPEPSGHPPSGNPPDRPPPISTLSIRREWWTTAVRQIPGAPIVGHGVASFVDETPEAHQMGVAGELTYPHNSPLESLWSLGVLGALPYLVYLGAPVAALVLLVRRARRASSTLLAVGLWVFAFASANVSGEIGADAVLWSAAALAAGLYADVTSSR